MEQEVALEAEEGTVGEAEEVAAVVAWWRARSRGREGMNGSGGVCVGEWRDSARA